MFHTALMGEGLYAFATNLTFLADLMRRLDLTCFIYYLFVSFYIEKTKISRLFLKFHLTPARTFSKTFFKHSTSCRSHSTTIATRSST